MPCLETHQRLAIPAASSSMEGLGLKLCVFMYKILLFSQAIPGLGVWWWWASASPSPPATLRCSRASRERTQRFGEPKSPANTRAVNGTFGSAGNWVCRVPPQLRALLGVGVRGQMGARGSWAGSAVLAAAPAVPAEPAEPPVPAAPGRSGRLEAVGKTGAAGWGEPRRQTVCPHLDPRTERWRWDTAVPGEVWIHPMVRWSAGGSAGVTCPRSAPARAEGRTRAPCPFGGVSPIPRAAVPRAEGT